MQACALAPAIATLLTRAHSLSRLAHAHSLQTVFCAAVDIKTVGGSPMVRTTISLAAYYSGRPAVGADQKQDGPAVLGHSRSAARQAASLVVCSPTDGNPIGAIQALGSLPLAFQALVDQLGAGGTILSAQPERDASILAALFADRHIAANHTSGRPPWEPIVLDYRKYCFELARAAGHSGPFALADATRIATARRSIDGAPRNAASLMMAVLEILAAG